MEIHSYYDLAFLATLFVRTEEGDNPGVVELTFEWDVGGGEVELIINTIQLLISSCFELCSHIFQLGGLGFYSFIDTNTFLQIHNTYIAWETQPRELRFSHSAVHSATHMTRYTLLSLTPPRPPSPSQPIGLLQCVCVW